VHVSVSKGMECGRCRLDVEFLYAHDGRMEYGQPVHATSKKDSSTEATRHLASFFFCIVHKYVYVLVVAILALVFFSNF
jgi:hypothetical protein